jgi:hypothetical protein
MQYNLIVLAIVLAAAERPEIPLPPLEKATLTVPTAAESAVSLGDRAPKAPKGAEPARQDASLAVSRATFTESAISPGARAGLVPRAVQPAQQAAKVAVPKPSGEAVTVLATPEAIAGQAAFLAPSETQRREILARHGLRYTADRRRRPLPDEFLLGGSAALWAKPDPKHANLVCVAQAGRDSDAQFLQRYPEVRFMVADERPDAVLGFRWLRLMDRDTCLGVVLGVTQCRWSSPESLAVTAQDLAEKRRYLRQLTDAPILLAVSRVNAQEQVNSEWIKAFGENDPWDGYAVVGFCTFRGLRDMGKPKICREAGVPEDRPAVVFNWYDAATSKGPAEDLARTRQVWQANAGPFVQKLLADGWRGFLMDLHTSEQLWSRMDYLQPLVEKAR